MNTIGIVVSFRAVGPFLTYYHIRTEFESNVV